MWDEYKYEENKYHEVYEKREVEGCRRRKIVMNYTTFKCMSWVL